MKDASTHLDNLPLQLQIDIVEFLKHCINLKALIDQENDILLEKGTIVFDNFAIQKLKLMDGFEPAIRKVFDKVKESQPHNAPLQSYLIEVIQDIRRSLCVNTTFHMSDLRKRTARIAQISDGLMNFVEMPTEEVPVCH
jgi:hypothetical protein